MVLLLVVGGWNNITAMNELPLKICSHSFRGMLFYEPTYGKVQTNELRYTGLSVATGKYEPLM
jgi:hypothetical protein